MRRLTPWGPRSGASNLAAVPGLPVRACQPKREGHAPRRVVPEGLNESSPARSGGVALKETTRPGRDDRGLLTLVKPHTRGPGAKTLLSSLPGRMSLFALFPSTSYWATFTLSLSGHEHVLARSAAGHARPYQADVRFWPGGAPELNPGFQPRETLSIR